MNLKYFSAADAGHSRAEWLDSLHVFSFNNFYNPRRMNYGKVRVFNHDVVLPESGFGMHPHKDMEIITIPLSGQLTHADSEQHQETLAFGDVQYMSAGTGIWHSEINHSNDKPVELLQIWILPASTDLPPRYSQHRYDFDKPEITVCEVIGPEGSNLPLTIHQKVRIWVMKPVTGQTLVHPIQETSFGCFVYVASGQCRVAGQTLTKGDALGLSGMSQVEINCDLPSFLVIIQTPID